MGVVKIQKGDREGRLLGGKWTEVPVQLRVTSGQSNSPDANLGVGVFCVSSTVDCYFLQGNATMNIDATNGHYLAAGQREFMRVDANEQNIAAVADSTAGYLYLSNLAR